MNVGKVLRTCTKLAKYNFKVRTEGSYIGIMWYLLNPLALFAVLFLVFNDRLGGGILNYGAYLLLGIVMFNFFQQTARESTGIIEANIEIIKFMRFPREMLILSMVIKNAFSHIFEIAAFIIIAVIMGSSIQGIIFYPLLFVPLFIFILGVSFLFSAVAVYFVDLDNIWIFISYLLWLATPIFYEIGGQGRLLLFNMFNPLYYFITIGRDIVVYSRIPEMWLVGGALSYSLIALLAGLLVFRRLKGRFAEML